MLVPVGRQESQGREARGGADGIAVECPAVAQRPRPAGIEAIHDLGPSAERSERIAAADDLAKRRQVRPNTEDALGAVRADPERDDLVEDQNGSDAIGVVAEEA